MNVLSPPIMKEVFQINNHPYNLTNRRILAQGVFELLTLFKCNAKRMQSVTCHSRWFLLVLTRSSTRSETHKGTDINHVYKY